MLKALQSQNPDRVKYWIGREWLGNQIHNSFSDAKQQLHFNIFTLFPDALKLFVHGCPTVTQHERWQRKVERWSLLDKQERKKKISEVLKKHPDGMIFASRIMVDTTFQLGDFYVTFVNGECPRFRWVWPGFFVCLFFSEQLDHWKQGCFRLDFLFILQKRDQIIRNSPSCCGPNWISCK